MKKKKIIRTLVSTGKYEQFIQDIINISKEKQSSYICVSNVHMAIEAYQSNSFCNIVNNANIATPDGMPLAKAMKLLYGIDQDRVAGMDLMPDLMKISEEKKLSIFLYGSTDDTLSTIFKKSKVEFPNLVINGYSPPFRQLTVQEEKAILENINELNPDFIFVALGCPKQEKWMAKYHGIINSCMIGLGGALEVYAGQKSRAPQWMQNYSLEWLYRLVQDPKRLWKRYLITNTLFVFLLIKQFIVFKIFKHNT